MTIRYTDDHEWIRLEGADVGVVGITHFAQDKLGDLVFVELPEVGRSVKQNEETAVIESVKAAADVKAPVAGTVIEVNQAVVDDPALVNRDPAGAGWFFKLKLANPADLGKLHDEAAYQKLIAE